MNYVEFDGKNVREKNRPRQKHMYRVFLYTREWYIGSEVYACACVCVCPGTCEVVCGRQERKLIKPMITLMRSQGVKLEKAFHFLSHSIPLSPTSIHPSLLYARVYTSALFFTGDIKTRSFSHLSDHVEFQCLSPNFVKQDFERVLFFTFVCIKCSG